MPTSAPKGSPKASVGNGKANTGPTLSPSASKSVPKTSTGPKDPLKPTPEESRKAFKQFQKGKGKAHDIPGHANSCTKCNHANDIAAAAMDPTKPPTMSPDCILYHQPTAYIPARAPKCFCPKEMTPSLENTYTILHDLFIRRLKLHDLPIVFYEEVAELEKTMIPEMIRDAMLGKGFSGEMDASSAVPQHAFEAASARSKIPGRKKRLHPFRLSEYPDAEARLEMREELVSLVKVLGKELMFDSTAPLILEELAYCGDVHGYSSLTHGPPCACVLNLCVPCLKVLADRLIPTATPQPLSRAPPDHAFLLYSAKALKSQHLSRETAQAMDRLDWEEELKACQKRAGDVLWETAMEIELVKTTRDVMGMFERAYDEDFYQDLLPMFQPEPGYEKESFKPVRDMKIINRYLRVISQEFDEEIQVKKNKAEKEKEKGNAAYQRGMFRRAAKHFSAAIELDPSEAVYPLNRALPLIKLRKYRMAERDCTFCINLNPRNTKALYRRALARRGLNKLVEAETDLKMVLAIEPANQASLKELREISQTLCQTPGSSAGNRSSLQAKVPLIKDSSTALAEREESESYWKERFVSSVDPDDGLHRGKTGQPCLAYNLGRYGCPLGRKCTNSHAPDEYSLRVNAFNRNVCTNHLLGRSCEPEDQSQDTDDPDDYNCPYMHADSEEDKKIVWREMQDIADKMRTDMGLDMKLTQKGFKNAIEAISSMRSSIMSAPSSTKFSKSDRSGMDVPPEIQQLLQDGMQSILTNAGKNVGQFDLEQMSISFDIPFPCGRPPKKAQTAQRNESTGRSGSGKTAKTTSQRA